MKQNFDHQLLQFFEGEFFSVFENRVLKAQASSTTDQVVHYF